MRGNTTSDARARRRFYQQAMVRAEEESSFGGDYIAFLASCDIKLQIGHYATDDLERVAELVQRTDQLNFSGRKYTRSELYTILDDAELDKFVLRCTDRYGSYGTIGFSIVRNTDDAVKVEDFMVSCRVQGKFLEQAFFSHLLQHHNERGARKLWVNFLPTAKNKPAQKILETLGFQGSAPGPGMVSSSKMECPFISRGVRCRSLIFYARGRVASLLAACTGNLAARHAREPLGMSTGTAGLRPRPGRGSARAPRVFTSNRLLLLFKNVKSRRKRAIFMRFGRPIPFS